MPLIQWKRERETGKGDQTSLEEMNESMSTEKESDLGKRVRLGGETEQISEQE